MGCGNGNFIEFFLSNNQNIQIVGLDNNLDLNLFEKCFVTNSICAPSRAVMLTGKHSFMNGSIHHKVQRNKTKKLTLVRAQEIGKLPADLSAWPSWTV